eukprot:c19940_g1_i2.p1 GENE.c19940_g1_i2~~c19940_g1_i2.p1  ORF type:complete len:137 (-),score=30.62 c19940_g1_i2:173-562(-)
MFRRTTEKSDRESLLGSKGNNIELGYVKKNYPVGGEGTQELLLKENDEHLNQLGRHISQFKGVVGDVHEDMLRHNSLLDNLSGQFGNTGVMMKKSMGKVSDLLKDESTLFVIKVASFVVIIFLLLRMIF